jgi:hypothetical protein
LSEQSSFAEVGINSRPFGLGLERILKGAWRRWRGVRCVFSVLPVTLYMY